MYLRLAIAALLLCATNQLDSLTPVDTIVGYSRVNSSTPCRGWARVVVTEEETETEEEEETEEEGVTMITVVTAGAVDTVDTVVTDMVWFAC